MLSVTKLLCGTPTPGDQVRYGETADGGRPRPVHERPVVVWNITRRCNLHCAHCYSDSHDRAYEGELDLDECRGVIDDLAKYQIPALLLSGGEPASRRDLVDIVRHAITRGVKPVLSTNGTLLNFGLADRLRKAGMERVGISLDGMQATHDKFRGFKGAFRSTLIGIRTARAVGLSVSLRATITKRNVAEVPALFDLAESEGIPRLCFYHLAYAGRGARLLPFDLDWTERRQILNFIFARTVQANQNGKRLEVLTVDNHADGPYLLMWSARHATHRTAEIERLLLRNGGNSAGKGIACIDNLGNVHPDQFWWSKTLGNVRERPFSHIWTDTSIEFLNQLRARKRLLPDRCVNCRWLALCNGNLRVRAETATGDPWGPDPACYLTADEIKAPAA
ncbi:MAG: radical SAM protein [Chloroflexi bacterium]|nr:radical SAM protein [Chloroflexota bacterium]